MARSDFFRNIPLDVAQELESLSRLQFELREFRKALLGGFGVEDADALCRQVSEGKLERAAAIEAVKAAVLEDEQTAVHAEMKARLPGGEAAYVSQNARVQAFLQENHPEIGAGSTRRFDAIELVDAKGLPRVLRIARPDFWCLEWAAGDGSVQCLVRLPSDEAPWRRNADGTWSECRMNDIPNEPAGLINSLLVYE